MAIHSAKQIDSSCHRFNLNPANLPTESVIGIVELVDVIEFTQETWQTLRNEHLHESPIPGKMKGWKLRNPYRIEKPLPLKGDRGIFDIPAEVEEQIKFSLRNEMGEFYR